MSEVGANAKRKLDDGLYCAESVLEAIAEHYGVKSELIPGIATGFCSGMARTSGTCGAVTGAMLGIDIVLGRKTASDSVEPNYAAVQKLMNRFNEAHGSANCKELLGCDLGTEKGRATFRKNELQLRCREFTEQAATMAIAIIDSSRRP